MDVSVAGCLFDVGACRPGAAIGYVVINRVVEQHGILRHHADRPCRRTLLGHRANVPVVDFDRAGVDIVEAVLKHFADIRSVKWALLNVWSLSRKFSTSPQARMHREYSASILLRSRGVATPAIIGAVLDDKVLVKEYIEGERLSDLVQGVLTGRSEETGTVEKFGEAMGAIHKAGFALGDTKATNVIVNGGGKLYFTDLEQATEGGDQAWDVAAFVYYQAKLSFKEAGMKKVAEAFLEATGGKTAPITS